MNHVVQQALASVTPVAAEYAASVDLDARFPVETIAALRSERLLGLIAPFIQHGRQEALADAGYVCRALGQMCGSSGLIYAMHLNQLACLAAMSGTSKWHANFLEQAVHGQLLLGSVTSEAGVGGDIRTSSCSLEVEGGRFELHKDAPTASYVAYADALLVTARRNASAASSDQVLLVVHRDDFEISETRKWDTLGMRGTCSGAYKLCARGDMAQVSPIPFAELAEQIMLPVSHVLWGSVWLGISSAAVERARAFLASKARNAMGGSLSGYIAAASLRLERAAAALRTMEARLQAAIESSARQQADVAAGKGLSLTSLVAINGLKITLSDQAVAIVTQCMQICGTEGYSNASTFSVARQLRDIQSAPLMVNNDRIAANNAHLALIQKNLATVI